jgi:hypothetical protein
VLEHGAPPENLVVLSVPDEAALWAVTQLFDGKLEKSLHARRRIYAFFEPDLHDELTALAVGPELWRDLSSLPLLK